MGDIPLIDFERCWIDFLVLSGGSDGICRRRLASATLQSVPIEAKSLFLPINDNGYMPGGIHEWSTWSYLRKMGGSDFA